MSEHEIAQEAHTKTIIVFNPEMQIAVQAAHPLDKVLLQKSGKEADPDFDYTAISGEVLIQDTYSGKLDSILSSLSGVGCNAKVVKFNETQQILQVIAHVPKIKPLHDSINEAHAEPEGPSWGNDILDNLYDPPPKYLIRNVLPQSSIGILFGITGSYKTFVAIDICIAIIQGTDWAGYRNQLGRKGRILYICCEGQAGFKIRVRAALEKHGDIDPNTFVWVYKKIPSFLTAEDVLAIIKETGHDKFPFDLVVIDTMSRVAAGGNTNDEQTMSVVLNMMELFKTPVTAVMTIAHPSRGNPYMVRGSGAQEGNVDFLINVEKLNADGSKLNSGGKAKSKSKGKAKPEDYVDELDEDDFNNLDTRRGVIVTQKNKDGKANLRIPFTTELVVVIPSDDPLEEDVTSFIVNYGDPDVKPLNKKAQILRQIQIMQPVTTAKLADALKELSGCQRSNLQNMLNKDGTDDKKFEAASLKKFVVRDITTINGVDTASYKLNAAGKKFADKAWANFNGELVGGKPLFSKNLSSPV